MEHDFDVVVVGAGHAGCEAAHAAARIGRTVGLVTMRREDIGTLSCNPAIGGVGKGHLVREIDAMDGLIGRVADRSAIHFRLLNASRGPAVRGPRVQVCRALYRREMRAAIEAMAAIEVVEGEVTALRRDGHRARGVELADGRCLTAAAVVLTTGTFLGGTIHVGDRRFAAGRMGANPSNRLGDALASGGVRLGRLKTGTPPRLDGTTIDWSRVDWQPGDATPSPLSSLGDPPAVPQVSCGITFTNENTHAVVRGNLHEAAAYSGAVAGTGPRYCPSIEDKIVRFPDRDRHQVFLEPESLEDDLVYPNGISTSLGEGTQELLVRSIHGLEECTVVRPGYAIEYAYADPRSLDAGLALGGCHGLFLAGQINGTTGYEEAAAQGLVAGINAARWVADDAPWHPTRSDSYIGLLCEDITRKGVTEPYRMFTSRSEHRLRLRPDNAVERLGEVAEGLGCLTAARRELHERLRSAKADVERRLGEVQVTAAVADRIGLRGGRGEHRTMMDLLGVSVADLPLFEEVLGGASPAERAALETLRADALYRGHEAREARRTTGGTGHASSIPHDFDYGAVPGLSMEARERLMIRRPRSIDEAAQYEGVTIAAIVALQQALRSTSAGAPER